MNLPPPLTFLRGAGAAATKLLLRQMERTPACVLELAKHLNSTYGKAPWQDLTEEQRRVWAGDAVELVEKVRQMVV